jgi:Flp pilus assembly secretin CpaC
MLSASYVMIVREIQMSSSGIRLFLASIIAASGLCHQALAQDDGMLRVYMDQARVLKLDRPVSKVIVGNAKVADATVADAKTIVLTGRSFGSTNLVLLDADGNAILDQSILVSIDEANTVRVFRQTERTVLSCTPNCEQHSDTSTPAAAAAP